MARPAPVRGKAGNGAPRAWESSQHGLAPRIRVARECRMTKRHTEHSLQTRVNLLGHQEDVSAPFAHTSKGPGHPAAPPPPNNHRHLPWPRFGWGCSPGGLWSRRGPQTAGWEQTL